MDFSANNKEHDLLEIVAGQEPSHVTDEQYIEIRVQVK